MFLYPEWIHLLFRLPLYTAVSTKVMSLMSLFDGWEVRVYLLMNLSKSGMPTSHNGKMSPIYRLQVIAFMTLLLKICLKIGHKEVRR